MQGKKKGLSSASREGPKWKAFAGPFHLRTLLVVEARQPHGDPTEDGGAKPLHATRPGATALAASA